MPVVRNPQFYFREGFCWSDISSEFIRSRQNNKAVYDVKSMSLFSCVSAISDKLIICLINSSLIGKYTKNFINNTISFQINDARQLPIVVPTQEQLQAFEAIFDRAYNLQVEKFQHKKNNEKALAQIQTQLDSMVYKLYGLKPIE